MADTISPSTLRPAPVDRPVLDTVAGRWSSRAIDAGRPVSRETLLTVLEAARWAPSSGNAQPWRYLVFDDTVAEARDRARACLNRGNAWARAAPVLLLSVVLCNWPGSEKRNRMAHHDVGAASLALSLQAVEEGLVVHQMAGFDVDRARRDFSVPDGAEPLAMIALGHPGAADDLPEDLRERERRPRARHAVEDFALLGGFGGPGLRGNGKDRP